MVADWSSAFFLAAALTFSSSASMSALRDSSSALSLSLSALVLARDSLCEL